MTRASRLRLVHRFLKYTGKTQVVKMQYVGGGSFEYTRHCHRNIPCRHCLKAKSALCSVCGRAEGCPDNYGGDVPMGEIERCDICGRWVCPVCGGNASEKECCFAGWDDRIEANPEDCPPGWRYVASGPYYERVPGFKRSKKKARR